MFRSRILKALGFIGALAFTFVSTIAAGGAHEHHVDTGSHGGMIKVYSADGSNFLKMHMDRIVEKDPEDKVVQGIHDLSSASYVWSPVSFDTVDGVNISETSMSTVFLNGAFFEISLQASVIPSLGFTRDYGNSTVTVPAWGIKWSIEFENWPWIDVGNTLDVRFMIKTGLQEKREKNGKGDGEIDDNEEEKRGRKNAIDECDKQRGGECSVHTIPGNGLVIAENMAIIDNEIPVNITAKTDIKGVNSFIVFTFPYFQNKIEYDPVSSIFSADTNDQSSYATSFGLDARFIACILSLLLVF